MMQSLASLQQSQQSESQEPYNLDEILSSSYIEDAKSSELLDRLKVLYLSIKWIYKLIKDGFESIKSIGTTFGSQ